MYANELVAPFDRLLSEISSPAQVRAMEAGAWAEPLWGALEESGYLDALVPEAAGGAGLTLPEAGELLRRVGRHLVPAPVAETMVARALLASAGIEFPAGPIALVTGRGERVGETPGAHAAEHLLVDRGEDLVLAPVEAARLEPLAHANLGAALIWNSEPSGPALAAPACGLRAIAAVLRAAAISGAADRLLEMTIEYANDRVQFGRPIGRQQAIQQNLAVMAEEVVAARLAAQIGCAGGLPPRLCDAATAKQVASSAAVTIANTAHSVHGAIGISEAHDLQLYTRRLHAWRLADGSEAYWARILGRERFAAAGDTSVDFIRREIATAL